MRGKVGESEGERLERVRGRWERVRGEVWRE